MSTLARRVEVYPSTSTAHADGVTLDVDLVNDDLLSAWQVRLIDVRGPGTTGSLISFEAGTPGFPLDAGRTWLKPGELLTGAIPIPLGLQHLDLTIQVLAVDEAGDAVSVELDLPASFQTSLPVISEVAIEPGTVSAKQQQFFTEWAAAKSSYPTAKAATAAYHELKAQRLGGAPATGGKP